MRKLTNLSWVVIGTLVVLIVLTIIFVPNTFYVGTIIGVTLIVALVVFIWYVTWERPKGWKPEVAFKVNSEIYFIHYKDFFSDLRNQLKKRNLDYQISEIAKDYPKLLLHYKEVEDDVDFDCIVIEVMPGYKEMFDYFELKVMELKESMKGFLAIPD